MFWLFGFLLFNNIFSQLCICQSELESIKKISQPLVLKFNTTNNILLKGEINEESSSKFIYDFNLIPNKNKNNTIVYLNTPGGSVQHGMKIVAEVEKYNLSCVAESAYSMGFIIFQACKNRYILSHGKLMQHQMALGIMDQKSRIESYLDFINQLEREIIENQAKRINKIVNVECSEALTRKTETISSGGYIYTYSKCPLISNYIKREKDKNAMNEFDIFKLFM